MRPLCGPVTTRLHLAVSLFTVTRPGLALPRVLCMYWPRARVLRHPGSFCPCSFVESPA